MPYQPKGSKVWWTSKPWRESTGTRDHAEALRYEQKLVIAHEEGHAVPRKYRTHGQSVDQGIRFFDAIERYSAEKGHTTSYHRDLNKSVMDMFFPSLLLKNLDDNMIAQAVTVLVKLGNAASTINKKLRRIEVVLERAAKVWKLQTHDIDFKMHRRAKAKVKHTFFLSHALEDNMLEYYREREMYDFVDFLVVSIETGMRTGEALQFLWPDLDLVNRRIYVRDWAKGQSIKTGEVRSIPMTQRCYDVLMRRSHTVITPVPSRVFDMFTDDMHIRRYWMMAVERFNLPTEKGATPRCTRRTCGTRLAMLGLSQAEIAAWLGHKSIASTEHYVNITSGRLDDVRKLLDSKSVDANKTLSKLFESGKQDASEPRDRPQKLVVNHKVPTLWEQDVGSSNLSTPTNSIVNSISYSFNIDNEEQSEG